MHEKIPAEPSMPARDQALQTQVAAFNQYDKQIDELYHLYAKHHGMTDTSLWLLYTLREHNDTCTQKELCADLCFPPQTINSLLQKLQTSGQVTLAPVPGSRKTKQVLLTPEGKALADRLVRPLMEAELAALGKLSPQERTTLLSITRTYAAALQQEIQQRLQPLQENDL